MPIQGLAYLASRRRMVQVLGKRVAFAPSGGGRAVVYRRIRTAGSAYPRKSAPVSV